MLNKQALALWPPGDWIPEGPYVTVPVGLCVLLCMCYCLCVSIIAGVGCITKC